MRTPVLRDEGGRLFIPSSIEEETVEPRQVLREAEIRELLDGEVWIPLKPSPARRGHVVVLRGPPFAGACRMVGLSNDLHWGDQHGRIDIAYAERYVVRDWRTHCAKRFVHWAERRIGEHLVAGGFPASLASAQQILELALFATDVGSPIRQRVFVLLGMVKAEVSPATWPMLERVAVAESPGLDRARLNEQIDAARRELKERAEGAGKRAWAQIPGQCSRPATL